MNYEQEIIALREKVAVLEHKALEHKEAFQKLFVGFATLESMLRDLADDPFGIKSHERNNDLS